MLRLAVFVCVLFVIACGLLWFPVVGVLHGAIGPTWLFQLSVRSLDRNHARGVEGAAFMAELMNTSAVEVGELYWIHRKQNEKDSLFLWL